MALPTPTSTAVFTVIGAGGFVGRRMVEYLRNRGYHVRAPGRQESSQYFSQPLGHIIYCAGLTADFQQRPFDTVEAHVTLLAQLLQRAQFDSLVYLSSTRLYDNLGAIDAHESLALHLDPQQPRHLYDLSKALGESLCLTAGQGRARIARLSCVFEGFDDADGFVPALLRQVRAARQLTQGPMCTVEVDSAPELERDYVHLPDVLTALEHIALRGQYGIYNVAGGCNIRNSALFDYISTRWSCQIQPLRSAVNATPRINVERMRTEFGWSAHDFWSVLDSLGEER